MVDSWSDGQYFGYAIILAILLYMVGVGVWETLALRFRSR